jgi:hypothetical protein
MEESSILALGSTHQCRLPDIILGDEGTQVGGSEFPLSGRNVFNNILILR